MNKEISYLSEEALKEDPDFLIGLLKMLLLFYVEDNPEHKFDLVVPYPDERFGRGIKKLGVSVDGKACILKLHEKCSECLQVEWHKMQCSQNPHGLTRLMAEEVAIELSHPAIESLTKKMEEEIYKDV